ncbi:MAG TPA: sulfatase-like hydrolase/transferase [Paludibacter sp.]|jgi:arylsulfatase A-like enzyme|nr:sulfatase-like hydrolase/transferase [Paludibacter sp.]
MKTKQNQFSKAGFSLLTSALVFQAGVSAEKKPNILFAFGDDLGRYASIYHEIEGGDDTPLSVLHTPNMDRVAQQGAVFLNAHVNAPQSTPSRSAILSGQYFWRTGRGAILQGAVWDSNIPSYPLILKENGYHIGRTYKVWSPGTPANAPYGGAQNKFESYGTDFCRFSQTVLRKTTDPEIEAEKQRLYDEVIGNFEEFLNANTGDLPFCYWWGPWNTHREWERGSGKKLWGIDPDDLIGKLPPSFPDIPEIREDFADYLGEVLAFDYALGLILKKLEDIGELDNTVIVISGDHGIPGFPRAKCNVYQLGTRVPLIVRYPAMVDSGRVINDFVNLMDLAPTFLEFGGVAIPEVMTGKSLVPILSAAGSGQIDPERTYVITGFERHVAAARDGNLPYPIRAITTSKYKYIRNMAPERWPIGRRSNNFPDIDGGPTKTWYLNNYTNPAYRYYMELAFGKRPYEELYDLENDPHELNNVANDAAYHADKMMLSQKLDSVLIATDDPRMKPGLCIYERYPFTISNQ